MRLKTLVLSIGTILAVAALLSPEVLAEDVDITADHLSRDAAGAISATGNVETKRLNETLQADYMHYDPEKNQVHAEGNVILTSPQTVIKAPSATMNTVTKDGEIIDANVFLPDGERLSGARIMRKGDYVYEVESAHFTPCPADSEAWGISAATATLDQDEGRLSATHARFELGGIPVFYSPYWSQPLRRKSGFLIPEYANGERRGSEYSIPYYWAPTPDWDATLTPHWMSARGFMPELEFRHVSAIGKEEIKLEGLSDKRLNRKHRSRIRGKIGWQLPYSMHLDINGDYTSDHDYLADLSQDLEDFSKSYTLSNATLGGYTEHGDWTLSGTYQDNLQTPRNAATLQIAPRLESHWALPVLDQFAILGFDQETTRFSRREGVDGTRMVLYPHIEIPTYYFGGAVSTSLTLGSHHTRYWLGNTQNSNRPVQTSAELGLEGRAELERIFQEGTLRHSIQPSLRYDSVAAVEKGAPPNFDSGFGQVTINNLMSGNRFAGSDRIEHSHRLSFSLTNRLAHKSMSSDASRMRSGKAEAGQIQEQMVRMPARTILETTIAASYDLKPPHQNTATRLSNIFGSLTLNPLSNLSVSANAQYDHHRRFWATADTGVTWHSKDGHNLGLAYQLKDERYSTPETRTLNLLGNVQISPRWALTGYMHRDLKLKLIQNASLDLKYTHACWNLKIGGMWLNRPTVTSNSKDFTYRILLEFKGFGNVGYQGAGKDIGL